MLTIQSSLLGTQSFYRLLNAYASAQTITRNVPISTVNAAQQNQQAIRKDWLVIVILPIIDA
jgi:hypothetical protein